MKFESAWAALLYIFGVPSPSGSGNDQLAQHTLSGIRVPVNNNKPVVHGIGLESPRIAPSKNPQSGKHFLCEYPGMPEFEKCHGPGNRGCWLAAKNGTKTYDINSDYESLDDIPIGITRRYWLDISEMPLSPDGVTMEHGKVFNRTYPGPWIEACWGDWIEVTVTNKLLYNGTSIHFHGIRNWLSSHMDGVNGITQCPIAPGDSFTYKFRAMQYGSSWYHSHYSLQYADGLLGPLTIYGPTTAEFDSDEAFKPILMTDWNHRSVFEDWPIMLESGTAPEMTNILLNGIGQYGPASSKRPTKYQMIFDKGKRHLLLLINTSVETTFVFSIDEHELEVVEADFVPIKPYLTKKILIGIGQRYHVIVHADPIKPNKYNNYWMRTIPARKCSKFSCGPDEQMGIIRYDQDGPNVRKDPTSDPFLFDIECADEPYSNLVPWRPWTVGDPANIASLEGNPTADKAFRFDVGMANSSGWPYVPDKYLMRWNIHLTPFRVNFSQPTILNLGYQEWPEYLDVITADHDDDQWIWLLITAPDDVPPDGQRLFIPAAHPMHLHGHDFAILKQSSTSWEIDKEVTELSCNGLGIQCENPPRRDVALLPASGYLILAFKADNPGVWIMHCHIAFHAASGLAMQIIENKDLINTTFQDDEAEIRRVCMNWDNWLSNPLNLWGLSPTIFQDDSGV